MRRVLFCVAGLGLALVGRPTETPAEVVFEATSPYHNIRVEDRGDLRVLCFDNTEESRMSRRNPLQGHFEYTEYFHLPWLWHTQMSRVLMIGLGGGSTQRAYAHYYPDVGVETVEIDPLVVQVARDYFGFKESPTQRVVVQDGRMHLRRDRTVQDAILLDAYSENRYGAFVPYHLTTREFFELARQRLSTNGVLAFNVMGTFQGWRADILGSIYQTLTRVFPQVYMFPARSSLNVVVIAVNADRRLSRAELQQRAEGLIRSGRVRLPTFRERLAVLRTDPPPAFKQCQVLTDDFAPVDRMLSPDR